MLLRGIDGLAYNHGRNSCLSMRDGEILIGPGVECVRVSRFRCQAKGRYAKLPAMF